MAPTTLFEVPIHASPSGKKLGTFEYGKQTGSIVCTSPSDKVYILSFSSPPDNRLTTGFCQAFLQALDILEFSHPAGVVLTTSAIPKFYSNGLDLDHAMSTPDFWGDSLYAVFKRLLTYPMPTIAVVNGHAFAGGLMLAMYHDYRIFNPARGFLCLNEIEFGVNLKPSMSSIFREKLKYPSTYRSMVLEAKRFNAQEALEGGIVDVLGGMEEALAMVEKLKLVEKTKSGIYGLMKAEMFRESLAFLNGHEAAAATQEQHKEADEQRKKEGAERVKGWSKSGLSKL